ncbi:hypothetical protein CKJ55_04710 [Mycobacterium avium]|uniref:Uncharacterized protein n=1 Tax=Mycobacterium avium TaxID=1764 RepID=A0A2A2ZNJ0_MYCAV|nr:hypothetical protein [Mycobacterium avium subsp. hominissuis]PBA28054.1 hypothetical protein CKJ66_04290 [Mycobacterium avium]MCA4740481.1 hypothetical protein [Mycobacterium avium subsp. hominissuis]MCA4744687.1 hypothetical protein [Mycobacterium avium subsp. hominissuis]MCA4764302.1 hypothetical protein [Mycobacterium avium subsp. hominissuis]
MVVVVAQRKRAVSALEAVLHTALRARSTEGPTRDLIVTLDNKDLRVRWLTVGWPQQVEAALHDKPRPDLIVAPRMSPGARAAAKKAGVGWVDESGAADIVIRDASGTTIIVETKGKPPVPLDSRIGWKPATLAVCEAILSGRATPTANSVIEVSGISMGSAVTALKFLEEAGHLVSSAARGPSAARRVADRDEFLDAYATAAERLRSPISIRVGVLWRDPAAGVIQTGQFLEAAGIDWAATSALSASVLAPMQTEVAPLEIYVAGKTWSDVRRAALVAGLQEMDGGRLVMRPFPTPAGAKLSETIADGFHSVLWPRAYADLRISGVRGEDAAEHLREEMTTTP